MQKSRSLKEHAAGLRKAFSRLQQSVAANKSRVDPQTILTELEYEIICLCDRIDAGDFEGGQMVPSQPLM